MNRQRESTSHPAIKITPKIYEISPMEPTVKFGVFEGLIKNKKSENLIISLSGFGDLREEHIKFECQNSIDEALPDTTAIFLRDTSRSWYTNTDGFEKLVEFLLGFIDSNQIKETTIFGVSMGAFGAVLLAKRLKAKRAIALSPRTLLGKNCTFDDRLLDYSSKILNFDNHDMRNLVDGIPEVTVIFSIDVKEDAAHAVRLFGSQARLLCCHGEHNIALTLKQRNQLVSFFRDSTSGNMNPVEFQFFELTSELGKLIYETTHINNKKNVLELIARLPESQTPSFVQRELYSFWMARFLTNTQESFRPFEALYAYPAHTGQTLQGPQITPYLGKGWARSEPFGSWGIGKHHIVRFKVTDLIPGKKVLVVLNFRILRHDSIPRINSYFFINGVAIDYPQNDSNTLQIESLVDESLVEIFIHTPNPMSPSKAGISADDRELSVALLKIAIYPR